MSTSQDTLDYVLRGRSLFEVPREFCPKSYTELHLPMYLVAEGSGLYFVYECSDFSNQKKLGYFTKEMLDPLTELKYIGKPLYDDPTLAEPLINLLNNLTSGVAGIEVYKRDSLMATGW